MAGNPGTFLKLWFGVILSCAQCVVLTLSSGVSPGGVQGETRCAAGHISNLINLVKGKSSA